MDDDEEPNGYLTREKDFTVLPDALIQDERIKKGRGQAMLLVYWVLCYHADARGRRAFPGLKRIARLARLGKASVVPAIADLIALGYLRKERRRNPKNPAEAASNLYTLLSPYHARRVAEAAAAGEGGVRPGLRGVPAGLRGGSGPDYGGSGGDYRSPGGGQEQDPSTKSQEQECAGAATATATRPRREHHDPVVREFVRLHRLLFPSLPDPTLDHAQVGGMLKRLRASYSDGQILAALAVAKTDPWIRSRPLRFDLPIILSATVFNRLVRETVGFGSSDRRCQHCGTGGQGERRICYYCGKEVG